MSRTYTLTSKNFDRTHTIYENKLGRKLRCACCGRGFKVGDIVVTTTTKRKLYHARCYRGLFVGVDG